MGIKGLTQLIKTNSPDAIQTMNLHNLSGKTVAIDASLFMYKMLINMRTNNQSYFKVSLFSKQTYFFIKI